MLLHEALAEEHAELRRGVRRAPGRADLAAIAIPERLGGAGLGHGALGAVLEELGALLAPSPLLGTAMAAEALLAAGDTAWIPRLAAGATAALVAGDLALAGAEQHVIMTDAGCEVRPAGGAALETLDPTRGLLRVEGTGGLVPDGARVLLAAEQLGGAARCLELAVAHARTREQFGRPIGSFQAVKHILADMLVRVEAARSASRYACWTLDHAPGDVPAAAAIAAVTCGEAYLRCAGDAVQVHGGIGFTWEHEIGRHLKRARSSAALLGGLGERRDAVARALEV